MKLPSADHLRIDLPFALLAALMAAGAGALAMAPYVFARGPSIKDQNALLEERAAAAKSADEALATLRARVDDLAASQQKAIHLRPASDIYGRIVELTDVAKECDASISQIAHQPAQAPISITEKDKAIVVPIKLAGTCTYDGATRLIARIRDRFPDTAVTAFHLAAQPSEKSPSAAFSIDLAWYTGQANPAASAAPAPKSP